MKVILTPKAPAPAGHYSQAIVHQGLVYVAGQLPIEPGTHRHEKGTIEDQTALVLRNLSAILEASGSSLSYVLKTTVYVSDISLWPRVNAAYATAFGDHKPARSVVPTKELHYGFGIEVDAIAAISE